jgi:FtsH-binding integral membrane protein
LQLHQLIFMGLWLTSCGYAAVRGGAPERIAAGAQFGAGVLTIVLSIALRPVAGAYASLEVGVALTDLALFGVVSAIALTSTRFWPLLQASMLGCGLLGHIAKPLAPDILPKAYYAVVAIWGYPNVLLLAVATWRHQLRLARYGIDHAWVSRLPRRYRDGWSVDELARPLPQP